MLVDSHCHLDFPEFAPELDAVMARARAADVVTCVTIGTKLSTFERTHAIAKRYTDVWCTIGSHPHEAKGEPLENPQSLLDAVRQPKVVGIGETGLDFYYEHSPREAQARNFRAHIAAARETDLPLIVHTRDADEETIAILEDEMAKGAFRGLIHCFTGSQKLADAALAMGFYISASGIATFKNSGQLRGILETVPLDRLLVETDAPYLAPVPHRGKRNEPAFVAHTAAAVAELKGVSGEALAQATTENFFRLFTKVTRPQ
jgi:TatD DNase family protein